MVFRGKKAWLSNFMRMDHHRSVCLGLMPSSGWRSVKAEEFPFHEEVLQEQNPKTDDKNAVAPSKEFETYRRFFDRVFGHVLATFLARF